MAQFLLDAHGVYRNLDRIVEVRNDNDDFLISYLDQKGEVQEATIDWRLWNWMTIATHPHVPCPTGHFVLTIRKEGGGNQLIRKDAVIAWRCHGGVMVPVTLHPEHDMDFFNGKAAVIEFPDGHIENLLGGNYASLQEYLDHRGDLDHQLTRVPLEAIMRRLRGEEDLEEFEEFTEEGDEEDPTPN